MHRFLSIIERRVPAAAEIGARRLISTAAVIVFAASIALLVSQVLGGADPERSISGLLGELQDDSGQPYSGVPLVGTVIDLFEAPEADDNGSPTPSATATSTSTATPGEGAPESTAGTDGADFGTAPPFPTFQPGTGGTAGLPPAQPPPGTAPPAPIDSPPPPSTGPTLPPPDPTLPPPDPTLPPPSTAPTLPPPDPTLPPPDPTLPPPDPTLPPSEPPPSEQPSPSESAEPECSDGIDNDGDGLTDFPADILGCVGPDDDDETNIIL